MRPRGRRRSPQRRGERKDHPPEPRRTERPANELRRLLRQRKPLPFTPSARAKNWHNSLKWRATPDSDDHYVYAIAL